ncbi:DNA-binding domain-containing protein [Marinomonas piezotolerans]|nr:DNA-binding domain-containing protein [Marinomonas piezotolerans]
MQAQFKAAVFSQNDALLKDIKAPHAHERNQRLNVYRNNVFSSLQTALADIFPVCKQLVGETFFNAMAHQYIMQCPPNSPILSHYGDQFSAFVAQFTPAQSLPYLPLLCDLEYRLLQLTHQAETPTLSLDMAQQQLSQIQNPEQLELHLDPNIQLLKAPLAIGALYLAHQQTNPNLDDIDLQQTEYLLLAKSGWYGRCYTLTEAEFVFLRGIKADPLLPNAIPDMEAFDLGQTLAKLMTWQVFTSIIESSANTHGES